jgi:penicillin-binding protein 1A
MARAVIRDVLGGSRQWWSTITQQLVKNLLLTPERTIKRKLKELVLTIKLWNLLEQQVEKSNPGISNKARDRKVKEKILELYLNYIFLWNNTYGVQAASKSYFASSAEDLWVFESAVLASIPKAPSKFDPYKNRAGLVWELEIVNINGEKTKLGDDATNELLNKIRSIVDDSKLKNKTESESMLKYLLGLIEFDFTYNNETFKVKYSLGRKDYVLARMYEDGFITIEQFKEALIKSMYYVFSNSKITIDSPHFVFWVLDLLKEPKNKYIGEFGEEMLKKWWLIIKTTLDLKIQQMALDSIQESIGSIKSYWWNNTALIHLDSKNGDVLAYIWSADYYNEAIDGNVDVIQRQRQPWSVIKPLRFALGFMKIPLTIDTNIFDIPFKIGNYDPDNVDGKFMWPMPLRKALAFSRNIPAIKMYFAVWEQNAFIDFAEQMWVTSFDKSKQYGPPMAIGAAEMKMFELATMYSHLSATGKPWEIDPILEIRRPDGNLLYKKNDTRPKQVIPSWVAYLLWKVLSDSSSLPPEWAKKFSFPGIKFAHKTWTSNWRSGDKILPRDWRLATYTPSKVSIFWAGNTSGKPMNADAYGWWVNWNTWSKFRNKLKTNGYLRNEDMKPVEVKQVSIAKYSWKLASQSTPDAMRVSSWAYINNLPTEYDGGARKVELDKLCMGKVSELTPQSDIITAYINEPQTFMPDKRDLKDIMKYTWKWYSIEIFDAGGERMSDVIYSEPTEECIERRFLTGEVLSGNTINSGSQNQNDFSLSIIKPTNGEVVEKTVSLWYSATSTESISEITILVNGNKVQTISYEKTSITDMKTLDVDAIAGNITVTVVAKTITGKTQSASVEINKNSQTSSNKLPAILNNQTTVKLENWIYTVNLFFTDPDGSVKSGVIKNATWDPIANFNGNITAIELNTLGVIQYTVYDNLWAKAEGTLDLTKLGQ